MLTKLKNWISKKVGNQSMVAQNDYLLEQALKQEKIIKAYDNAFVALDEKYNNNTMALYQIISSLMLKEDNQELIISRDLLLASQQAPEIQLSNNEDGALIIRFVDPKTYEIENDEN